MRWLRAGYPDRASGPDRVPLLALLRSTPLTDDQIDDIVGRITESRETPSIDRHQIGECITEVTHHDAGPENVERVAARLAAAGWTVT